MPKIKEDLDRKPFTALSNKKREAYCQARAREGLIKVRAYEKAFGSSKYASQLAHQLEKEPIIQERIKEIEKEVLEDLTPTLSWLYKLRKEAILKLRDLKDSGDVKVELQAAVKILDYTENKINELENKYADVIEDQKTLTDEEIEDQIAKIEAELGLNDDE